MKWQALIILLAIALGISVPPSLHALFHYGATTATGGIDVCH